MNLIQVDYAHFSVEHSRLFRQTYAGYGVDVAGFNVATFQMLIPNGGGANSQRVTLCSENFQGWCAEQALMREVAGDVANGALVIWVFTERRPCGPVLNNCSNTLDQFLVQHGFLQGGTPVYYLEEYPNVSRKDKGPEGKAKAKVNKKLSTYGTKIYSDHIKSIAKV
jgi:hypothetical protein